MSPLEIRALLPRARREVHRDPEARSSGGSACMWDRATDAARGSRRRADPPRDLSHDRPHLRGRDHPPARPLLREGRRLLRREAGALVLLVQDRARRGRGRIRGPHRPVDVRASSPVHGLEARVPALAGQPVVVVIWTTTPWTLPANLAVALHPDLPYVAVEVGGEALDRRRGAAREGRGSCWAGRAPQVARAVHRRGARGRGRRLDRRPRAGRAPVSRWPRGPPRARRARPRRPRDARCRNGRASTRRPATAPTTSASDSSYGLAAVQPGRRRRHVPCRRRSAPEWLKGVHVLEGERRASSRTSPRAACSSATSRTRTATRTAGAATTRCCSARPRSGSSRWRRSGLRAAGARRDPRDALASRLRRGAHRADDRDPPRLVHLAPAHLGRSDPRRRLHARASPSTRTPSCASRRSSSTSRRLVPGGGLGRVVRRPGRRASTAVRVGRDAPRPARARGRRLPALRPARRARVPRAHRRRLVRVRASRTRRCSAATRGSPGPPTSTSKGTTSTAAGSTRRCSSAVERPRACAVPRGRHARLHPRRRRPEDVEVARAT